MENFIYEEPHNLHPDVCKYIIEKFRRDDRTYKGKIGLGEVDVDIKDTVDLSLCLHSDWKDVEAHLYSRLSLGLDNYIRNLKQKIKSPDGDTIEIMVTFQDIHDSGYVIHQYKKGGKFKWHHDDSEIKIRKLTCIWYLNTIGDDCGGCTEFQFGKKVKPEEGKLLIFPSTWNYLHRGQELLKGEKFIINSFIMKDLVKV